MSRIVTLATDFGTASGYVAQMKGAFFCRLHEHARQAAASGSRSATDAVDLVDLAHDLPAHDATAAAWFVLASCFSFPAETLHVVVVDPGVGSDRPILYARIGSQRFLAPDNGLLGPAARRHGLLELREVRVPGGAAVTFHGRDVFAPTAADLTHGVSASLGDPTQTLTELAWPTPSDTADGIHGEIIHVDHFGNLITNLPDSLLPRLAAVGRIRCGTRTVDRVVSTYAMASRGSLVALAGSQGFLEIAVVEGRADTLLGAGRGTHVLLELTSPSVAST